MARLLNAESSRGSAGSRVNGALATLILVNILAVALESVPSINARLGGVLTLVERFSVAVFSVEYLLRVWVCVESPKYAHPVFGRMRYAFTPMALVDLLAIVPSYLPYLGVNLLTLRAFRLVRLLRLLKLGRYSEALQRLGRVVHRKRFELASTAVIAVFLLVVAAALLHAAEGVEQPDRFGSLPDAMWWAVVTMTTVGYGDVYPVTPVGRVLGSFVAFLGVGLFALPTGILGAGFLEESNRARLQETAKRHCPHCGGALDSVPEGAGSLRDGGSLGVASRDRDGS
jgi:voltage-gated potassium channel